MTSVNHQTCHSRFHVVDIATVSSETAVHFPILDSMAVAVEGAIERIVHSVHAKAEEVGFATHINVVGKFEINACVIVKLHIHSILDFEDIVLGLNQIRTGGSTLTIKLVGNHL